MFYWVFGQAYSRNYIEVDFYNKLCINKEKKYTRLYLKMDGDLESVSAGNEDIKRFDSYMGHSSGQGTQKHYIFSQNGIQELLKNLEKV